MSLSADQITIAITVYNRRQYLKQAIASALNQTVPVRVIVVEDCGPDLQLRQFVHREFGDRVEYLRNPYRRGLFDNWNAAMEHCRTPWLSILHDDDYLAPCFAEAMVALSHTAPDCGLFFGQTQIVNDQNEPIQEGMRPPMHTPWRRITLADTVDNTPFPFAGQLFRLEHAQAVGGFNVASQFAGDWEMWCQLITRFGAAQTSATVAYCRTHGGLERGTSKIVLNGRLRPLVFIQQKRVLQLMRQEGQAARFERAEYLRRAPMSAAYLVRHGLGLSPRILRYNVGLLRRSPSPSLQHRLFKTATRCFGVGFVKLAARLYRLGSGVGKPSSGLRP
jgi:hypothetical protein